MKITKIPKKSGGFRNIYVQSPVEKYKYRVLGHKLAQFNEDFGTGVAHGFVEGRSPVSNAKEHKNKKFSLSLDLCDFFDSVTTKHLTDAGVNFNLADGVCIGGSIKQGLSSSPAAANVAAIPLDKEILSILPASTIYTRYADDLTFSSDILEDLLVLRDKIPEIAQKFKFSVNNKKTRLQSANYGRRIITGIAVDAEINPTKNQRRRLRAAQHNINKLKSLLLFLLWCGNDCWGLILELNRKNVARFIGLKEWCKLKDPTRSLGGKLIVTATIQKAKEIFP